MEAEEIVLWSVLTVFVIGAIAGIVTAVRGRAARPSPDSEQAGVIGDAVSVTLDIVAAGAPDERVERIMRDASARLFSAMPNVDRAELRDRDGVLLGVHRREPAHDLAPPIDVREPTAAPHRGDVPSWMAPIAEGEPVLGAEPAASARWSVSDFIEPPRTHVPLVDQLDLPHAVRATLQPGAGAVDVVRAILEAAGHAPVVQEDLLLVGDRAVVVLKDPDTSPEALSHAYFRFKASRAREGLVVVVGPIDPVDVKRRELLEPSLVHVGVLGVQRMADAVALGADPLRFARAPAMQVRPAQAAAS